MPPLIKSSYSLYGRFTGSILLLGLASLSGVAQGAELEADATLADSLAAAPAIAIAEPNAVSGPAQASQNPERTASPTRLSLSSTPELVAQATPLLAVADASARPETSIAWPELPASRAEVPLGDVLLLASEVPQGLPVYVAPPGAVAPGGLVPWYVTQLPPGVAAPSVPAPASAGGYYPAVPYPGGTWVMMWMPYGVPMAAPGAEAAPQWPQPTAGFPVAAPYGMAPPQGYGAGAIPQGYPAGVGAVPWGNPYGAAPPPYGYGAVPQLPPTLPPLAQIAPAGAPLGVPMLPAGTAPGTVPPLPGASAAWGQTAPLPSVASGTYLPPGTPSGLLSQSSGFEAPPLAPEAAIAPASLPEPNLNLQGLYVLQGDRSSARARLSGDAFLTPNLVVGGALDLVTGPDLTADDGVQLTELYLATAVPGAPGLRFRLGQLDLTSYFDRNSFAKDISRDFFNPVFQTNPALIGGANATASRPGGLVQWAVTDDITLNAAVFSSSADITDFALDGFAGEVGFRTGDLILRGTFITSRDTGFQNTGGRLDAYGVNAEWFLPRLT
jgi:hypothetical protein